MSKVVVLDELTACQIAAGEVIERPASVIKELVENSIDAGSNSISVEIKRGGITYIRVSDNGSGIEADDAVICFDKHATSKIRSGKDLESVSTLGFRGEALASIAAVGDVELLSKTKDDDVATYVHIKGGDVIETGTKGGAQGTTITVSDLFFNTPARFKFLKKDQTEAAYCADVIEKMALAHPEISFRLVSSGQEVFRTPGDGDIKSAIYCIFGKTVSENILKIQYEMNGYSISGYAGVKEAVFGNRSKQIFFVNGRYIKSKVITSALDEAYKTVVMKNKFPFAVININVPFMLVDVNVHPTKTEVRFSSEGDVFKVVYRGISNAVYYKDVSVEKSAAPTPAPTGQVLVSQVRIAQAPVHVAVPSHAPAKEPSSFFTAQTPKAPNSSDTKPEQITDNWKLLFPVKETQPLKVSEEAEVLPLSSDEARSPELLIKDYNYFTDGRIIGQVFMTYILLQYEDKMILIDQHAAHERIKYEELKSNMGRDDIPVIPMLVPQTITLTAADYGAYCENQQFFTDMGFEIEEFGNNTIIVRAVPMTLEAADLEDVILEGLTGKNSARDSDEKIFRMACKAAIKANKNLSLEEIKALMCQLSKLDSPNTCPHGRPISIEITQHELERKFKRCL